MVTMAAKIPVRFERVAAAFDADFARVRLCDSSGSDHSPEGLSNTDLSDLVKSFMERSEVVEDGDVARGVHEGGDESGEMVCGDVERDGWFGCDEEKEKLKRLFEGIKDDDDDDENNVREKIRSEVEGAFGFVGDKLSPEFKRRLMARLRHNGFDAGLCKSKWERSGRYPGGDYEYIDINMGGKRYIVEVNLAAQFDIARPTNNYSSLLNIFPLIFVGKSEEMKKIVRLMCTAMKVSMKKMDLSVPPWRRSSYVQAKWLGSYKRTTNEVSTKKKDHKDVVFATRRSIVDEFDGKFVIKAYNNCRDNFEKKGKPVFRVGLLATALNS